MEQNFERSTQITQHPQEFEEYEKPIYQYKPLKQNLNHIIWNHTHSSLLTQTPRLRFLHEAGWKREPATSGGWQIFIKGTNNGIIQVLQFETGKPICNIEDGQYPVTSVRWRKSKQEPNVLLAANAEGYLTHYHVPSGKPIFKLQQQQNSILAIDTKQDGSLFATAGKDLSIRIYDQSNSYLQVTKTIETLIQPGKWNQRGHSNRIFSLKFIEDNLLLSCGWDSNIFVWDIRTGNPQRSIYGASVSGDCVDYRQGKILTGSHRNKEQIQLYDLGTQKLYKSIPYTSKETAYVFSCLFMGSSGANQLRIFGEKMKYRTSVLVKMGGGCYSSVSNNHLLSYCNSLGQLVCFKVSK